MNYHLAQVNVALPLFPRGDARIAGFFDNIEAINAIADASPGFIWRSMDEETEAEAERVFAEPGLVFNLSLWESPQALRDFVYHSDHLQFLRKRAQWFRPRGGPAFALWWIAAGKQPTVTEARHRLDRLQHVGPSEDAFTFNSIFLPPGG